MVTVRIEIASEAISLSVNPLLVANAFTVQLLVTVKGAVYKVDDVVGVEPSIV